LHAVLTRLACKDYREHVNADPEQLFRLPGRSGVQAMDAEHLIATIAVTCGEVSILLPCSLSNFSEPPIREGRLFLDSRSYPFFEGKQVIDLEAYFFCNGYSGSPEHGLPLALLVTRSAPGIAI
jgi:hypothetical protein